MYIRPRARSRRRPPPRRPALPGTAPAGGGERILLFKCLQIIIIIMIIIIIIIHIVIIMMRKKYIYIYIYIIIIIIIITITLIVVVVFGVVCAVCVCYLLVFAASSGSLHVGDAGGQPDHLLVGAGQVAARALPLGCC